MAIKNMRQSVQINTSEDRLKNKLKESYTRFLNEAEEDELDLEGGDEDLGMDADMGGDDMDLGLEDGPEGDAPMDDTADLGMDTGLNAIENLEDTEKAQVNDWIKDLLSDSLDTEEINSDESLDTEASADSLDPMGEEQYINDEVPMTVDELENIIDSDDTLSALESALAEMAIDADNEGSDMDMDLDGEEGMEMDTDLGMEDFGSDEEEEILDESHDPMAAINKYFDQGFEGEDVKDELMEDVELAPASKEEGFKKVEKGLNDDINSTVSNTTGAGEPVDTTAIIKESEMKSAMLAKASVWIANQVKLQESLNKQVADLKLENYKLLKTNGLLSTAGDKLDAETRNKISESFDRCTTIDQVNKFYGKITEKLKAAVRPSLNESVNSKKTRINVLKESNDVPTETLAQQRINMLMGLPTKDDVYFNI